MQLRADAVVAYPNCLANLLQEGAVSSIFHRAEKAVYKTSLCALKSKVKKFAISGDFPYISQSGLAVPANETKMAAGRKYIFIRELLETIPTISDGDIAMPGLRDIRKSAVVKHGRSRATHC